MMAEAAAGLSPAGGADVITEGGWWCFELEEQWRRYRALGNTYCSLSLGSAWEGRSAGEVREKLGARMSRDCVLQVVTNNRSVVH